MNLIKFATELKYLRWLAEGEAKTRRKQKYRRKRVLANAKKMGISDERLDSTT